VKSLIHGWLSDELLARLGDDIYDTYLYDYDEDGNPVSPLKYLRPEGPTIADEAAAALAADRFLRLINA
jgi:hypothetical protein